MKYAIDKPKHQQLHVSYRSIEELIPFLNMLRSRGFFVADYLGTDEYNFPIVTVSYLDKKVYGSNATCMAAICSCGGTSISIQTFYEEILDKDTE